MIDPASIAVVSDKHLVRMPGWPAGVVSFDPMSVKLDENLTIETRNGDKSSSFSFQELGRVL